MKAIPILAVTALSAQLFAQGSARAEENPPPTPPPVTRPAPTAPIAEPPAPPAPSDPRKPSGNGKRACFDDACDT